MLQCACGGQRTTFGNWFSFHITEASYLLCGLLMHELLGDSPVSISHLAISDATERRFLGEASSEDQASSMRLALKDLHSALLLHSYMCLQNISLS